MTLWSLFVEKAASVAQAKRSIFNFSKSNESSSVTFIKLKLTKDYLNYSYKVYLLQPLITPKATWLEIEPTWCQEVPDLADDREDDWRRVDEECPEKFVPLSS